MKLNKLLPVIFWVLPLLLPVGCGESPQPAKPAKSQTAQTPPAPQPDTKEAPAAPTSAVWPFVSEGSAAADIADNLTGRNFLLIFDGSGSMQQAECSGGLRKIDAAKQAVKAWSKSVPEDANLGLYAFHNGGFLSLPLASGNRNAFMQAIDQIVAGGGTPLAEAMEYAYEEFTKQGKRQLGYGEYTIVVVTDGRANSISELRKEVDIILSKTPINIFSIGFCIGDQHSLNQPGRTVYRSADNPQELQRGLKEVLAESETFDEQEFSQ